MVLKPKMVNISYISESPMIDPEFSGKLRKKAASHIIGATSRRLLLDITLECKYVGAK